MKDSTVVPWLAHITERADKTKIVVFGALYSVLIILFILYMKFLVVLSWRYYGDKYITRVLTRPLTKGLMGKKLTSMHQIIPLVLVYGDLCRTC